MPRAEPIAKPAELDCLAAALSTGFFVVPAASASAGIPPEGPMRYAITTRTVVILTLAATTVVACSDQLTEPNVASTSTGQSSASNAATPTPDLRASAASALAWQARARDLVTTHPATFSPIVAGRAYA